MRRLITVSILALLLVFGCVQGALWQYDRYETRHANNELIRKNISIATLLTEDELSSKTASELLGAVFHLKETLIQAKSS